MIELHIKIRGFKQKHLHTQLMLIVINILYLRISSIFFHFFFSAIVVNDQSPADLGHRDNTCRPLVKNQLIVCTRIRQGHVFLWALKLMVIFFFNFNFTFLSTWGFANDFFKMLLKFKMVARGELQNSLGHKNFNSEHRSSS